MQFLYNPVQILSDIRALGVSIFKITSLLRSLRTLNGCLKGFKTDITEAQENSGSVTLMLKYPSTLYKYQGKSFSSIAIR